jgi:hypothetical protein
MVNYLVTCQCGQDVPVSAGEAGGTTRCTACGTQVNVPSFRSLKNLTTVEVADPEETPEQRSDTLGFRWSVRVLVLTVVFFWAGQVYAMAVSGTGMPLPLRWFLFLVGTGAFVEMCFFLIRLRDVHGNRPL